MRYIIKMYDSVGQFAQCMRGQNNKVFRNKKDSVDNGKSFTGTESYDEADRLLRCGDAESCELLKTSLKKIRMKGSGTTRSRELCASVTGFAPIVPNAIQGLPLSMMNTRVKERVNQKIVTVVYNACVSGAWDIEEIADAGAQVLDFVRQVEAGGARVNLYVMFASSARTECAAAIIKVKDSTQYTNVLRAAYPMVNPSMLRRHFFRFLETTDITDDDFRRGYGHVSFEDEVKEVLKSMKYDKYISAYEIRKHRRVM